MPAFIEVKDRKTKKDVLIAVGAIRSVTTIKEEPKGSFTLIVAGNSGQNMIETEENYASVKTKILA